MNATVSLVSQGVQFRQKFSLDGRFVKWLIHAQSRVSRDITIYIFDFTYNFLD